MSIKEFIIENFPKIIKINEGDGYGSRLFVGYAGVLLDESEKLAKELLEKYIYTSDAFSSKELEEKIIEEIISHIKTLKTHILALIVEIEFDSNLEFNKLQKKLVSSAYLFAFIKRCKDEARKHDNDSYDIAIRFAIAFNKVNLLLEQNVIPKEIIKQVQELYKNAPTINLKAPHRSLSEEDRERLQQDIVSSTKKSIKITSHKDYFERIAKEKKSERLKTLIIKKDEEKKSEELQLRNSLFEDGKVTTPVSSDKASNEAKEEEVRTESKEKESKESIPQPGVHTAQHYLPSSKESPIQGIKKQNKLRLKKASSTDEVLEKSVPKGMKKTQSEIGFSFWGRPKPRPSSTTNLGIGALGNNHFGDKLNPNDPITKALLNHGKKEVKKR